MTYQQTNNAFFRQLLYLCLIIFLGIVIFIHTRFFFGAFLGAFTFYIVLRKMHFRLTGRYGWKRWMSALLLVVIMTLLLGALGFFTIRTLAGQIPSIDAHQIYAKLQNLVQTVNDSLGFQAVSHNVLSELSNVLTKFLTSLLNTTYSFGANIFMMLLILYFMLANARKLEEKVLLYQPFRGDSLQQIGEEIRNMVYGNAIGLPIIMIGQGIVAGIIYWAYGFESPAFLALMTALCGLIPMVGTALVSAPLGISLIASGHTIGGILLIALGVLVIANVDNLIRIVLMKRMADTHPLIVIFGVILGIPLFGFWGIIFGPLLISGFLLLIRIYYREYGLVPKNKPVPEKQNGKDDLLQ